MDDYTTFGDWIRRRRKIVDLTQPELAAQSFYSEIAIRNIEKDAMRPSEAGAVHLAAALEIPDKYLPIFVAAARGDRPLTDLPLPQDIKSISDQVGSVLAARQHRAYAFLVRDDALHVMDAERARKLVGRRELLDTIHELLKHSQHIVLQGAGGRGKTAVAAELVYERAAASHAPVVWVHVGEDAPEHIFVVMAELFGTERSVVQQRTPELRAKLLADLFYRAGVSLVVFDNVWDGSVLSMLLRAVPRSIPILVTSQSRFPLDDGIVVEMQDLTPADALTLFGNAAQKDFSESDQAMKLCKWLGYLPLALVMAGKTLHTDKLSVDVYLKEIEDYPHQVEMPLQMEPGHESMSAVIEMALKRLDARTHQAFMAFGALYEPGVTADLLALYTNRPRKAVQRVLLELHRRGLVERIVKVTEEVSLYQLHSLTHSYTRQHFRGKGRGEHSRFARACLNYITLHKQKPEVLHAEHTNLIKAAAKAYENSQDALLIDMMRLLAIESPYVATRGHDALLLKQLDHAIVCVQKTEQEVENRRLEHFLLGKRGNAHYDCGELDEALDCYQRALKIVEELKDMPEREVILHGVISKVYTDKKALSDAAFHLERSSGIAAALMNDAWVMRSMEYAGYFYAQGLKDFERARTAFANLKVLAEQYGDNVSLFPALLNLGSTYHDTKQLDVAISLFEQALQVAEQFGFYCWKADALFALAMSHDELRSRELAESSFQKARLLFYECGIFATAYKVEDEMDKRGYSYALSSRVS